MNRFRRILKYLLLLFLLVLAAGFFFVQHLKPDYDGTRTLAGISDSVRVAYDHYGIPHISGKTEQDAVRALGYVHAQDRLWQMELLRRVARGGLSEVFGPTVLDTDRFFLTLGIDDATRRVLANVRKESPEYRIAQAYLDGVNAFIAEGPTPIEYYLTGLDKTPFTLEDVYNAVGYMAFSFAMAHKTDPLLTGIRDRLAPEYLAELLDEEPGSTAVIPVYDARDTLEPVSLSAAADIGKLLEHLPLPMLEGSNSWVIGPSKTSSGKVLFANDPHIGFAQPSVWFEAHVRVPGYEKYGYHLAGVPFPLLGHDRKVAYGLTMFENDDIDFYSERTDPADSTRYLRPDGWKRFETVEKTIAVKGEQPVTFRYRKTDRGPVVNPVIPSLQGQSPVSMSWVYTQGENRVLQALYGIAHASGLDQFEKAVRKIHAPGLNVMYGDASGNVAWWAAARLYRLPDSVSTLTFMDGSTTGPGFVREVPFEENPKALNPPAGYVYSANNQPDSTGAGYIPGYYLPENRARRIVSLLDDRSDWDREGVMEMITDVTSPVNREVISNLSRHVELATLNVSQTECVDALNKWDGTYTTDRQEGLLYHRWIYYFLRNTFADELDAEGFNALLSTHLVKRLIARMAARENSLWWDDITTPDTVETKSQIISRSFREATESVEKDFGPDSDNWRWGEVHQLEFKHAIGRVPGLRWLFNVGPFPVDGTREVISNMAFNYDSTGYYGVTSGPSTRRVIDFSDIGSSVSILPTGQSGNPFSPHYDDQSELYIKGEFRPMLLDPEAIRRDMRNELIFVPE